MASNPPSARKGPWLFALLLVMASAVGSLALACVMPFAAFAVASAYALSARAALVTVASIWLLNQVIGFGILGYPWTGETMLWGLAIGAAAVAATALARAAISQSAMPNTAAALCVALLTAFGAYEAVLFGVTFALGGQEAFTPAIVGHLALVNLGWAIALIGTWEIAKRAGFLAPSNARAIGSGALIRPT